MTTNEDMSPSANTATGQESRSALSLPMFAWAAFLAMSWTWCIGMFLPVLLVRDFGLTGWFVFAAPNVIGAGAMGWVLRSSQVSREIVREHRAAGFAFSFVTIAFHFFFSSWIIARLVGFEGEIAFLSAVGLFYMIGRVHPSHDLASAMWVLVCSLVAMTLFFARPSVEAPSLSPNDVSVVGLVSLSTVCVFGFAFCPYLDLTFHRARRSTRGPVTKLAFAVGFGGIFLLMIVFTLLYARTVGAAIFGRLDLFKQDAVLAWAIAGHMAVQSGFTIAVHQRELRRRGGPWVREATIGLLIVGSLVMLRNLPGSLELSDLSQSVVAYIFPYQGKFASMTGGELLYRLFMSFYGLFFPAYVWLRIVPPGGPLLKRPPVSMKFYFLITLLVSPLFYLGFVEKQYVCLIPGVLALLFGRFGKSRAAN